jgi:hypothetical protein
VNLVYKGPIVIVNMLAGLKSAEVVLRDAFLALGCERWGGASDNGWSKLSDFLRCPYRYHLKHMRRVKASLAAASSPAQDVGSFVHALLAAYYAGKLPAPFADENGQLVTYPGWQANAPTLEALLVALREAGAEAAALALATRLWEGYIEHWGEDGIQPVAVEMGVGDPEFHTSRYDMVFSVVDGVHDGLWIGEHKTASPATDMESWQLDGEILGEELSWDLSKLSDMFGAPLRGICINVLLKTKVPAYRRLWQPVRPKLIAEFTKQRMHWNSMIAFYKRNGLWPKSSYGCIAKFGKCSYWDHCLSLSDSFLVPIEE